MATIARPVQDMLPFDPPFDVDLRAVPFAPVYDEQAREADRELCQRYFKAWCGSFASLEGKPAGHPDVSFAQFQAAADRLAQPGE